MAIFAIIAEYDPFHLGHLHQIEKIREIDGDAKIIAIMSSSFVQRGTNSLFDKKLRASLAKNHGVDLVLELPFPYCSANAKYFAKSFRKTAKIPQFYTETRFLILIEPGF